MICDRLTNPMDAAAELAALQENFDVTGLGSGDPIVGFNLLASMACTLAHLAPDDGAVFHPDGSPARLGTSLLVIGGSSAGRVVDEIITEVNRRQNNLISHLQGYFEWLDRNKDKPDFSRPPEPSAGASVGLITETQSEFGDMSKGHAGSWRKVLERLPHQTIRQIEKHPKFLVSLGGGKTWVHSSNGCAPGARWFTSASPIPTTSPYSLRRDRHSWKAAIRSTTAPVQSKATSSSRIRCMS